MPSGRRREGEGTAALVAADGIDALPDGVLAHILGFMPAEEAVRTCVLARRWHHLWKTGLRVVATCGRFLRSAGKLLEFMDRLLPLREGAPLDTCDLDIGDFKSHNWIDREGCRLHEPVQCSLNAWLQHAVRSRAQAISLRHGGLTGLLGSPLVSERLTRLELGRVNLESSFLDFLGCRALEYLALDDCVLCGEMISFESIKHLRFTYCTFFIEDGNSRTRIYAPNVISLQIDESVGYTPILESMPSLDKAFVKISQEATDQCDKWNANYWDCDCQSCELPDAINGSVLLKGLSDAKDLTLISDLTMFVFKRDMTYCPTFGKLKALWLNEYWCERGDFRSLACILKHSPVLEKLTLQLFSEGLNIKCKMEGSVSLTERSTEISEHLKTVEVKCEAVDERIIKVLKFLGVFNLYVSGTRSDLPSHYINTLLQIVAFDLRSEEIQAAVVHCFSPSRNGRLKPVLTMLPSFVHG
ncbi:hypothetical protein ACP4OV_024197 [Aristida adscensionis]